MQNLKKSNKIKAIILNSPPLELESINLGTKDKIESYNRDDDRTLELNDKNSNHTLSHLINESNKNLSDKINQDINNNNNNLNDHIKININTNLNKNIINNNSNQIKKITVKKNNNLYNKKNKNFIPRKIIKKEKHLCYKFTDNPQRFFTADLCDNILKAYDILPKKNSQIKRINSASPSTRLIYNNKKKMKNNNLKNTINNTINIKSYNYETISKKEERENKIKITKK